MGREVKCVPLDFNWPLREAWEGYVNPHVEKMEDCHSCNGSGGSFIFRALDAMWYGYGRDYAISLAEQYHDEEVRNKAIEFIKTISGRWMNHLEQQDVDVLWENGRLRDFGDVVSGDSCPSAEVVNSWSHRSIMPHDAINNLFVIGNRCNQFGAERDCNICNGNGYVFRTPEDERAYEEWDRTEPPHGDGYQLWENVSDGSPVSPVFESARDLSFWMMGGGYEEWQYMAVRNGEMWLPSAYVYRGTKNA